MLYFVVTSYIFRKSRIDELREIAEFRIINSFNNLFVIDTDEGFISKLANHRPVFVYSAFPIMVSMPIRKEKYIESIEEAALRTNPEPGKRIMAECFDVNSKEGYSAKDIEVRLGRRLESMEFQTDLKNPEAMLYVVLMDMVCYAGYLNVDKMDKPFLNPERHYLKMGGRISRAELKLLEALDEFQIVSEGIALDLGAAPGGWSRIIAKRGLKVIAIDKGELDLESLDKEGVRSMSVSGTSFSCNEIKKLLDSCDILHIRESAAEVDPSGMCGVGLLLNDINTGPKESSEILKRYVGCLCDGARVIMTVKCIKKKASTYIRQAEEGLRGQLKVTGVRALPSNRQEVTLYAVKRHVDIPDTEK
jgi:23S rRNA (cytidine2498-2'-O)-methyltransferase